MAHDHALLNLTTDQIKRIQDGYLGQIKLTEDQLITVLRTIPEQVADRLEIVSDILVLRGANEPDYPAGVEYGPLPYSDAMMLADMTQVCGYTSPERP